MPSNSDDTNAILCEIRDLLFQREQQYKDHLANLEREKVGRPLDVDNIAKTIIDSFCAKQISRDASAFSQLAIHPDDTFHLLYCRYSGLPVYLHYLSM